MRPRIPAGRDGPATNDAAAFFGGGSLALIELSRVFRHFEAADEVGIARHSAHLLADAIGLLRRQKHRPLVDEYLPHGLFALNAL